MRVLAVRNVFLLLASGSAFRRTNSAIRMDQVRAKSFQDLVVWQKAHQFTLSVYRFSDYFPQKETYGLVPQFRRAAISIAANIAEGFKKEDRSDRVRYMNTAQDSLEQCRYYLVLAKDLGYGDDPEMLPQLEVVSTLLEEYTAAIMDTGS